MTPEQQTLYYRKELKEAEDKIKSLESKLAEKTKECEDLKTFDIGNLKAKLDEAEKELESLKFDDESPKYWLSEYNMLYAKYAKLEAEAKAIRSKTIEECAKVAEDGNLIINPNEYASQAIARVIRALNSENGEQV